MTDVVVLYGGNSPEREVSIRSGKSVMTALDQAGIAYTSFDTANGLEFLDTLPKDSVVLPILHGVGGEDGSIQKELERRGLAYLGATSRVSEVCFDKSKALEVFQKNNIPTAAGAVVSQAEYASHPLAKKPHVLKVARGGSSIGTLLVPDPTAVDKQQVQALFELDDTAILEELVQGIEITVPVLDGKALPVIEIKPPEGGEFDYENKYNGKTAEICPPVSIDEATQKEAQHVAERVYEAVGCRHLGRVDIIVRPDGSMAVLEINTIPGMTDQSLFPKAAEVAGMDFPALVTKFVELAREDGGKQHDV